MHADKQRMVLPQHRAQFRRDKMRQKNWNPRANPQKLNVRDRAQLAEQRLEFLITEQQWVATAQEHIANGRRAPNIIDLPVELRMKIITGRVAHQARASAIPA